MAEIPIERKGRRNWLPLLLLGLLALALLAWLLSRRGDDRTAVAAADSTRTATVASGGDVAAGAAAGAMAGDANGAIDQFTQFVQARDTSVESEGQHQYTAEGTRRLAAALEALAPNGTPDIRVYADSMRASIERLQRSSATDRHADDAKAAFSAAVSAMEAIDRNANRTRDLAAVRATFRDLDGSRPLMPQLDTVHRFFEAARDALGAMRG